MANMGNKQEIKKAYGMHANDSGGTEVQVALLTSRILGLNEHLKQFPKDNSTRRGLIKMVGQRRRLLNYLIQSKGHAEYKELIKRLGLRK